jgi:hypothetical protein
MKKTVKFLAIALGSAFIAIACDKEVNLEEQAPVTEEPAQRTVRTFTCTFAEADTKVDIDHSDGKTTWEVGDEIMVHGGTDGATFEVVTLKAGDISADGKKATISFSVGPYDRTADNIESQYYAQYPASAVPTGDNMYYECRFDDTKKLLMGACNVGDTFVFFHLSGIIAYKVSGSFAKAVFSGNNNEAVAYDVYQARVRKDSGKDARCYYWKPGNGSGTPVASTIYTSVPVCDGTTVNYIYLPSGIGAKDQYNVSYSGVNFTNGFTIKFLDGDDNEVKRVSTNTPKNIHAGDLLDLGDISSHLYTYTPPATHDSSIDMTGAVDLSSSASSNCYLLDSNVDVAANKVYTFKAYKGKSTTNVGAINSVEVLWETWNNAETVTANSVIADVDYDKQSANDYYTIVFKMPATLHAGNAVIAAKNSGGSILWSWHIWVPSTTVTSNTYGIYSSALMDRYLGALVAATTSSVPVESFGLHYEWGRKDPFVGARGIADNNFAKVSGTAISIGYEMTLAETIANPTKYAVYTSSDSWGNWLSPTYDATLWQNDTKTIYDPCPVGYKVPKRNTDQPMHKSDLSTVTGWSDNVAAGDNAAYFTLGSPVTVFPYCGLVCENGKYMDHLGARTFIWTAYASSSSGSGYIMDVRLNSTHTVTSTVTSRGCSIRCVVE